MKTKSRHFAAAIVAAAAVFCLLTVPVQRAAADERWDNLVAEMEAREKVKSEGPAVLQKLAAIAPEGSGDEVWAMSLCAPDTLTRAAAAFEMMNRLIPDGDPSRWEEAGGFVPQTSYVPLQLVAVNSLFNTVIALTQLGDEQSLYGAAYLMQRFGDVARGKVFFIDFIGQPLREALDTLIAKKLLPAASWESKQVGGPWPFVPRYNGTITRTRATEGDFVLLDGYGRISSTSGLYAWDRKRGLHYSIIEEGTIRFRMF